MPLARVELARSKRATGFRPAVSTVPTREAKAAEQGFEPWLTGSRPAVLPLDDSARSHRTGVISLTGLVTYWRERGRTFVTWVRAKRPAIRRLSIGAPSSTDARTGGILRTRELNSALKVMGLEWSPDHLTAILRFCRKTRFCLKRQKCPNWDSNPEAEIFEIPRYANSRHLGK